MCVCVCVPLCKGVDRVHTAIIPAAQGDLTEECVKLGLGKKGSKEDLVTRLMTFSLDNQPGTDDEEEEEEEKKTTTTTAKGGKKDEEDEKEMTEEEKKEAERLFKREQVLDPYAVRTRPVRTGPVLDPVLDPYSTRTPPVFNPYLTRIRPVLDP